MDPTLLSQLPVAISTAKGLLTSNTRERLAQNNRQLATMDYDALVYEFKRIWGLL